MNSSLKYATHSTKGNGTWQTQDTDKIHTEKRFKQQNKIFLYLFTGGIPFCMCLHAVSTFYVNIVDNS